MQVHCYTTAATTHTYTWWVEVETDDLSLGQGQGQYGQVVGKFNSGKYGQSAAFHAAQLASKWRRKSPSEILR
jgi:hypothetical protein